MGNQDERDATPNLDPNLVAVTPKLQDPCTFTLKNIYLSLCDVNSSLLNFQLCNFQKWDVLY